MEEQTIDPNEAQLPVTEPKPGFNYFPFFNQKQPVFVLILIGIIFYCTSLYNEYALDDGIIIHENSYVLKGVKGIKDILTKDAYDNFYKRMNAKDQLQGGRYRPLSAISFAIEQEFIGTYRSGLYLQVEDLNRNHVLDNDPVTYIKIKPSQNSNASNPSDSFVNRDTGIEENYEYNDFVDLNHDGIAQPNECYNCWDLNKNFKNDPSEDLNQDGVFNEIDCQVKGAIVRHFNNIWLYILGCLLLYLVFRNHIFKNSPDMAFLAALIFLTHPVHSEVVANVKSRDEILSLIFISLCFLFSFRFVESKKITDGAIACVALLLALLSKEYALMMFVLVPLALYTFNNVTFDLKKIILPLLIFVIAIISLVILDVTAYAYSEQPFIYSTTVTVYALLIAFAFKNTLMDKNANSLMLCFFAVGLCYVALRLGAVNTAPGVPDTELLNNPYLLATHEEQFATKIFILLKYLILCIFPHPLISDYSYAAISYRHFGDVSFIFALLINVALLVLCIRFILKRHVLGFALSIYFIYLLLLDNFFFAVGATMHESFLFHSSIGVAIAFAWLIIKGFDKLQALAFSNRRAILIGSLTVVVFLYGCKTWERNWDWKNDVTLFLKDVKSSPNSVLILGNAGARWIDLADTKEVTGIILPGEKSGSFNDYNGQLKITDEEVKEGGYKDKREAALQRGIGYLKHAIELHPRYVNGYLNLGLAYFKLQKEKEAIYYWKCAENLYPFNPYLSNYYQVYSGMLKDRGTKAFTTNHFDTAVMEFTKWTIILPSEKEAWFNLGGAYFNLHRYNDAKYYWNKALEIDPNYEDVKKMMALIPVK